MNLQQVMQLVETQMETAITDMEMVCLAMNGLGLLFSCSLVGEETASEVMAVDMAILAVALPALHRLMSVRQ